MLEGAARAEAKRLAGLMRAELQKAYERQSAARHGSDEQTEADTDVDTLLARVDELVEQSRPPKRQATLQVGGGGAVMVAAPAPTGTGAARVAADKPWPPWVDELFWDHPKDTPSVTILEKCGDQMFEILAPFLQAALEARTAGRCISLDWTYALAGRSKDREQEFHMGEAVEFHPSEFALPAEQLDEEGEQGGGTDDHAEWFGSLPLGGAGAVLFVLGEFKHVLGSAPRASFVRF